MEGPLGKYQYLQKCFSLLVISVAILLAAACSKAGSNSNAPTSSEKPSEPNETEYNIFPLSWESTSKPERRQWTEFLHDAILKKWNTLLSGADDIGDFCPRYHSLDNDQRANVWAALLSAMSNFESGYNPRMRYHESTMGTDSVTGKPVYSEGLLQLSYQDVRGYPFCEFDWNRDKNLSATDPQKTIFDPYKNLDCGAGIMARQIARRGEIALSTGPYWSVIKEGGKYSKLPQIKAMVKSLPFCN